MQSTNVQKVHKSVLYRNWLYDVCSKTRKIMTGTTEKAKPKNIWKTKPENWPEDQIFYDPRNTSYMCVKDHESLLSALLEYCDQRNLSLDESIQHEINAWKNKDTGELIRLYRIRDSVEKIKHDWGLIMQLRIFFKPSDFGSVSIEIDSNDGWKPNNSKMPSKSAAIRSLACALCNIYHGKNPEMKIDNIWSQKPELWPNDVPYYNPNNKRQRNEQFEDSRLVRTLINLCEKRARDEGKTTIIPSEYEEIIAAFNSNETDRLITLLVLKKHTEKLRKIVLRLQKDNLLKEPVVKERMNDFGLKCTFREQHVNPCSPVPNYQQKKAKHASQTKETDTGSLKRRRSSLTDPCYKSSDEEYYEEVITTCNDDLKPSNNECPAQQMIPMDTLANVAKLDPHFLISLDRFLHG